MEHESRYWLGLVSTAGVIAGACHILDPTFDERALIIFYQQSQFTAPDSAARGEPVTVTIKTFGSGCLRGIARTLVAVRGQVAEIRPYNEISRAPRCGLDDILHIVNHSVSVAFDQPGVATIRVVEEQEPFEGRFNERGPAELERQMVIH